MNLFKIQGKPLHVRRRIAIVATGTIGIILVLIMIYVYTHPQRSHPDIEQGIMSVYTTIIEKVQSLFH